MCPARALQLSVMVPSESTMDSIIGGDTTMILNVLAALSWGTPSSKTRMVTELVPDGWLLGTDQEKTPVIESTVAPTGAPGSRLKVSTLVGKSASVAEFVSVNCDPGKSIWSGTGVSAGTLFSSFTTTVNVPAALSGGLPLSVTCTVIG